MIEAIISGSTPPDDAESALAQRLFERALAGFPAPIRVRSATSVEALARLAPALLPRDFPTDGKILLLAHDRLLPAPGCIEILADALDGGLASAAACDAAGCGGADYLTLRGFERFTASKRQLNAATGPDAAAPLALVARLAALTAGKWYPAPRLPNAWVHDFSGYRTHRREEMLALLPEECPSLLDVGGGAGGFVAALKARRPDCRTALVEMSRPACEQAQAHADRVWEGDFLSLGIDERFGCISFLDVLEHVTEPLAMLAKARSLLTADGCVIASIPNVGHWSIVADLLEGRWDYAPAGILCITHLRFFTRHGIAALFAEAGLVIEAWSGERLPPPPWFETRTLASHLAIDEESLATVAWHCRARPGR